MLDFYVCLCYLNNLDAGKTAKMKDNSEIEVKQYADGFKNWSLPVSFLF